MNLIVTLMNLFALILGAVSVGLALRLVKKYEYPFLHPYLYFLICSVVSGFFDWISFNWIIFLSPDFTSHNVDSVYHIFWDLIGFPCALFASYFMLITIFNLVDVKFNKKYGRLFILIILILSVFSFIGLYFRFENTSILPVYINWMIFIYVLPLIQLIVLIFGLKKSFELKNSVRIYSKRFILIILAGYFVWNFLMHLQVNLGIWRYLTIMTFYIGLFLPVYYLHNYFNKQKNTNGAKDPLTKKLKEFLKESDLTDREKEVTTLLINGLSNQQIADDLFISLQTVKNYVSRIFKKLNLKSRLELINYIRNWHIK